MGTKTCLLILGRVVETHMETIYYSCARRHLPIPISALSRSDPADPINRLLAQGKKERYFDVVKAAYKLTEKGTSILP